MKKQKESGRQLHKKKYRVVLGFFTFFILLCLAGGTMVAKYYAGRRNKGVATASSLYFTSNLLKNVSNVTEDNYPVIYNTDAWDGVNPYQFSLEIRNYQNQLLYNDRNLDIQYQINFQLVGTTDGGSYQVTYGSETKTITSNSACSFTAGLAGGQARADQFSVSFARPEGNTSSTYRSVGIRVTATPVSPDYVANYETLGGILYASIVSSKFELKGEFSKIPTGKVGQYAGFPYTISYKPGVDGATRKIRITWDSSKLQLDQFSPYYASKQEDSGENNKDYIEITMEPYASMDILFYRTDAFDPNTTIDALNGLVVITDKGGVTP